MTTTNGAPLISSAEAREIRYSDEFKNTLIKLSDACVGVFLIRTREPYRAQEVIQDFAIDQELRYKVWTILTGHQSFHTPTQNDAADLDVYKPMSRDDKYDPLAAWDAIEAEPLTGDEGACFVMMGLQYAFEVPSIQQHIKAHVRRALEKRSRVIMLVPEGTQIPTSIEPDIHVLDFRTPSHAELRDAWDDMLSNLEEGLQPPFGDEGVDSILQNSLGMSYHEFDTALAIAFVELRERLGDGSDDITPHDFIEIIMRTKVEVLRKTNMLSRMEPVDPDTIGGLDILKRYISVRAKAMTPAAREWGVDTPRGILLVGVPGTGKSLIAKAISRILGIECINFDISRVFGQFVGQSEGQMDVALKMIDSVAPCVLFMDEIDKGLGGMGGNSDSGTTGRVFGKLLTWMQERKVTDSPVFVVMTANNVIGLPPELMRKGRVDEIFAVSFPSDKERVEILRIHLNKRGHGDDITDAELRDIATATKDFVGAELEAIVVAALTEAFNDDAEVLTVDYLMAQARSIIPISVAFRDKIQVMYDWAKNNAKPASTGMTFDLERKSAMPDVAGDEPRKTFLKRGANAKPGVRRKPGSTEG